MTRAKKILRYRLLTILLLVGIAYLLVNHFLESLSREAMQTLSQRGQRYGVEITEPQFKKATLTGNERVRGVSPDRGLRAIVFMKRLGPHERTIAGH